MRALKGTRPLWLVLAVVATLTARAATVHAQVPSTVDVDVASLAEGWYDEGHWTALLVDLHNRGPDARFTLTASNGRFDHYSVAVSLPAGARQRVHIYMPADTRLYLVPERTESGRSRGGTIKNLVELRSTEGQPLVAVLSHAPPSPSGLEALGPGNGAKVAAMRPAEVPEQSLALGSVDFVVVRDTAVADLTAPQQQALYEWVALGGQVVVMGGRAAADTLAALPERLRPAGAGPPSEIAGAAFAAAIAPVAAPTGTVTVAALTPAEGASTIARTDEGAALAIRLPVGRGAVTALAYDPAAPPLGGWPRADALWHALHLSSEDSIWSRPRPSARAIGASARSLAAIRQPTLRQVTAWLAIYAILVGPVTGLLLARRRQLARARFVVPALSLAAIASAGLAGALFFPGRPFAYRMSSTEVVPEAGVALVREVVVLYSPVARRYDVRVPGALASNASSHDASHYFGWVSSENLTRGHLAAWQGADAGVRGLEVEAWGLNGFAVDAVVDWSGPSSVGSLDVDRAGDVEGSIVNPFGQEVDGVVILWPSRVESLGRLGVNEARQVRRAPRAVSDRPASSDTTSSDEESDGESVRELVPPTGSADFDRIQLPLRRGLLGATYGRTRRDSDGIETLIPYPRRAVLLGFAETSPLDMALSPDGGGTQLVSLLRAAMPDIPSRPASEAPPVRGAALIDEGICRPHVTLMTLDNRAPPVYVSFDAGGDGSLWAGRRVRVLERVSASMDAYRPEGAAAALRASAWRWGSSEWADLGTIVVRSAKAGQPLAATLRLPAIREFTDSVDGQLLLRFAPPDPQERDWRAYPEFLLCADLWLELDGGVTSGSRESRKSDVAP